MKHPALSWPFNTISLPRIPLPTLDSPWWALSIMSSLWLLLILHDHPVSAQSVLFEPWQLVAAFAATGACYGTALKSLPGRAWHALLLVLILVLAWGVILAGHQYDYLYHGWHPLHHPPRLVGYALTALLVSILVTWRLLSAVPILRHVADSIGRASGWLVLFCAASIAFLPISPADTLINAIPVPADFMAWLAGIPQRIYLLIRGAMIWVPLGFVLVLAGAGGGLKVWIAAGLITFPLVAWPFVSALATADLMEILFAAVGTWAGLWLGQRTARVATSLSMGSGENANVDKIEHERPALAVKAITQKEDPLTDAKAANRQRRFFSLGLPRPRPVSLLTATLLLTLATWLWWTFPRFHFPLGVGLLLYFLLLLRFRHGWMLVIPAVLPALDLAPWTGRFFFDESDLFLLVTLAVALLHGRVAGAAPLLPRTLFLLAAMFGITTLVSLANGLLPLSTLDANAFASYFSHFNALRVGKGFLWGWAMLMLLRWTLPPDATQPGRLFTWGMLLGLALVVLVGIWERSHYAGLFDFSTGYRITATFSSMHTGGSHLPAFLALAVPFIWLALMQSRRLGSLPPGIVLLAGAVYLVVVSVTRAAFLALALELMLLLLFSWCSLQGRSARSTVALTGLAGVILAAAGLLYLGTQGSFFQQRLASSQADLATRMNHWDDALSIRDEGALVHLSGMGLGTFPETYMLRNLKGTVPGNFSYATEGGNGFLLLGSGETLYLGQRIDIQPNTSYRLSFELKGDNRNLRISIPLCEKHLLKSLACAWNTYTLPGAEGWQRKEVTINSGSIGSGAWYTHPPIELYLYNAEQDQLLAVDNLSLRDPAGRELLRNGDFQAGGDFWFMRTHEHLAWHIKNLWVALLFEQGWLGLLAFSLLLPALLLHLGLRAWHGNPTAAAVVTALSGFLALGLFASPFDVPRLVTLFTLTAAFGLHGARVPRQQAHKQGN